MIYGQVSNFSKSRHQYSLKMIMFKGTLRYRSYLTYFFRILQNQKMFSKISSPGRPSYTTSIRNGRKLTFLLLLVSKVRALFQRQCRETKHNPHLSRHSTVTKSQICESGICPNVEEEDQFPNLASAIRISSQLPHFSSLIPVRPHPIDHLSSMINLLSSSFWSH